MSETSNVVNHTRYNIDMNIDLYTASFTNSGLGEPQQPCSMSYRMVEVYKNAENVQEFIISVV